RAMWGPSIGIRLGLRYPITGIAGRCCALAASGHAAAVLPSRVMNSRRFNWSNCMQSSVDWQCAQDIKICEDQSGGVEAILRPAADGEAAQLRSGSYASRGAGGRPQVTSAALSKTRRKLLAGAAIGQIGVLTRFPPERPDIAYSPSCQRVVPNPD